MAIPVFAAVLGGVIRGAAGAAGPAAGAAGRAVSSAASRLKPISSGLLRRTLRAKRPRNTSPFNNLNKNIKDILNKDPVDITAQDLTSLKDFFDEKSLSNTEEFSTTEQRAIKSFISTLSSNIGSDPTLRKNSYFKQLKKQLDSEMRDGQISVSKHLILQLSGVAASLSGIRGMTNDKEIRKKTDKILNDYSAFLKKSQSDFDNLSKKSNSLFSRFFDFFNIKRKINITPTDWSHLPKLPSKNGLERFLKNAGFLSVLGPFLFGMLKNTEPFKTIFAIGGDFLKVIGKLTMLSMEGWSKIFDIGKYIYENWLPSWEQTKQAWENTKKAAEQLKSDIDSLADLAKKGKEKISDFFGGKNSELKKEIFKDVDDLSFGTDNDKKDFLNVIGNITDEKLLKTFSDAIFMISEFDKNVRNQLIDKTFIDKDVIDASDPKKQKKAIRGLATMRSLLDGVIAQGKKADEAYKKAIQDLSKTDEFLGTSVDVAKEKLHKHTLYQRFRESLSKCIDLKNHINESVNKLSESKPQIKDVFKDLVKQQRGKTNFTGIYVEIDHPTNAESLKENYRVQDPKTGIAIINDSAYLSQIKSPRIRDLILLSKEFKSAVEEDNMNYLRELEKEFGKKRIRNISKNKTIAYDVVSEILKITSPKFGYVLFTNFKKELSDLQRYLTTPIMNDYVFAALEHYIEKKDFKNILRVSFFAAACNLFIVMQFFKLILTNKDTFKSEEVQKLLSKYSSLEVDVDVGKVFLDSLSNEKVINDFFKNNTQIDSFSGREVKVEDSKFDKILASSKDAKHVSTINAEMREFSGRAEVYNPENRNGDIDMSLDSIGDMPQSPLETSSNSPTLAPTAGATTGITSGASLETPEAPVESQTPTQSSSSIDLNAPKNVEEMNASIRQENKIANYQNKSSEIFQKLNEGADKYGFNRSEKALFLANTYHETGGYTTLAEKWGRDHTPYSYFIGKWRYHTKNGNNNNVLDGMKYRGRGVIQLTGRANYERFQSATGIPVVDDPTLVSMNPDIAVQTAFHYWLNRGSGLRENAQRGDQNKSYRHKVRQLINGTKALGFDHVEQLFRHFYNSEGKGEAVTNEPQSITSEKTPAGNGTLGDYIKKKYTTGAFKAEKGTANNPYASGGYCAKAVKWGIRDVLGIPYVSGHANSFIGGYPGFKLITKVKVPQAGAIEKQMPPGTLAVGDYSPHGHMQVKSSDGTWVSDFIQSNFVNKTSQPNSNVAFFSPPGVSTNIDLSNINIPTEGQSSPAVMTAAQSPVFGGVISVPTMISTPSYDYGRPGPTRERAIQTQPQVINNNVATIVNQNDLIYPSLIDTFIL